MMWPTWLVNVPVAAIRPGHEMMNGVGNSPLVHPHFVFAKGRVGGVGPADFETAVGFAGARHAAGHVAAVRIRPGIEGFGTGAVVGEEQDHGVFRRTDAMNRIEDPANPAVHAVDHRAIDRHPQIPFGTVRLRDVGPGPGDGIARRKGARRGDHAQLFLAGIPVGGAGHPNRRGSCRGVLQCPAAGRARENAGTYSRDAGRRAGRHGCDRALRSVPRPNR